MAEEVSPCRDITAPATAHEKQPHAEKSTKAAALAADIAELRLAQPENLSSSESKGQPMGLQELVLSVVQELSAAKTVENGQKCPKMIQTVKVSRAFGKGSPGPSSPRLRSVAVLCCVRFGLCRCSWCLACRVVSCEPSQTHRHNAVMHDERLTGAASQGYMERFAADWNEWKRYCFFDQSKKYTRNLIATGASP